MSDAEAQIERIVRQVLAEMGLAAAPQAPAQPPPQACALGVPSTPLGAPQNPAAKAPAGSSHSSAPGDWVVRQRVVTLSALPERWDAVRRVVVPEGAVVTPAVQDELQRRGVLLAHQPGSLGTPANPRVPSAESCQVRVVSVSRTYDSRPLALALAQDGYAATASRLECLIAATDQLATELAAGLPAAVLLSRHTAAALCLANRHRGVRAILGTTAEGVSADAEAVGANLLVLDPRRQSLFAMRQMALALLRGAPRPCPEVFQSRLA